MSSAKSVNRPAQGNQETRSESPADALRQLSVSLIGIADDLEARGASEDGVAERVRCVIAARRRRSMIATEVFADPAWDIMLALFLSALEGENVSVSEACIASNVPPTTALRWIGVLVDMGIVVRTQSRRDARRTDLTLSGEHHARMVEFFSRIDQSTAVI